MASGLGPAAASDAPPLACMSIGGEGTQFSSTCDSCVVTDGSATIDRDESTYGTLEIVTAGSGTMRATAPSGVVFPAGSSAAILSSIDFSGDIEMSLRTYAGSVLQEEFVIDLDEHPYRDGRTLAAFRTTLQYDAIEFSVSQLDPNTAPPFVCQPYAMPCVSYAPHRVMARIREFCSGPDMTPDAFAFSEQAGVEPGTRVASAPVTITGIEAPVSISVSGGGYSIGCTETFTFAAGSISNGETVCVRHWAASGFGGHMSTELTVGGVSGVFTSRTRAADVTPAAFSFTDQGGVDPGATVTSAAVTISGIEAPASISVTGGEYSIGCTASFTSAGGTIAKDQIVCVRHTAGSFGETTTTTLTVGGVADAFSSTVRAADATPDAFSFVDQDGVATGSTITSNPVTIGGIEVPVPVSVSGGEYSISCSGTFTSAAGSIVSGQTVCVRHASAGTHGTATNTTLTVGGISDTFTSTTAAAPAEPPTPPAQAQGGGGGAPSPWLLGVLAAVATVRRRYGLAGSSDWTGVTRRLREGFMGQIYRLQGLTFMTFGLVFMAGCDGGGGDPTRACMSIGGGGTQFSSTGGVTDGPATIDRDESTYGTLTILSAGSGTMRATAQGGVVFPAGSDAGILQSISYSGDVELSLRTYENNVLQEEFAFLPGHYAPEVVSFKTTRQYDAIEFSATQLSADTDTPGSCYSGVPICNSPHGVTARIHEFCSN